MRILLKLIITALIVTSVSELGKRFSWAAAILASLPVTSILALVWLYRDTHDEKKVSELSYGILWAVLPSLLFFWVLPTLMKMGLRFPLALAFASAVMAITYTGYAILLRRLGIHAL